MYRYNMQTISKNRYKNVFLFHDVLFYTTFTRAKMDIAVSRHWKKFIEFLRRLGRNTAVAELLHVHSQLELIGNFALGRSRIYKRSEPWKWKHHYLAQPSQHYIIIMGINTQDANLKN